MLFVMLLRSFFKHNYAAWYFESSAAHPIYVKSAIPTITYKEEEK